MKRILITPSLIVTLAMLLPLRTAAQQPAEAQRLGPLVGEWTFDHVDGGSRCDWLGDFIVRCQSHWTNASGNAVEAVFFVRWDAAQESYTGYRFYSGGYTDSGPGWFDGDTWTFVYEGPQGARYRFVAELSGDKETYTWHRSLQGGPWEQTETGSMTRVR
jgi:hypothetical protein